ncbi:two-component system response regulator [Salinigranum rubrum]|uniref:Two-component system response regulator n=1 Tax=Salinigranum rubrum TaxID=755307 RepID=A0A2I8VQ35_9EURY|nr:response regulator [Salinigranum rubrum]AUV83229.1 two-component system response regulator [Salinigranum rubrum]
MTPGRDGDPVEILLVEDNPGDVRLTQEAFKELQLTNEMSVVTDGAEALDFMHRRGEYASVSLPDLVLLDLNLPKVDGIEVLKQLKSDPELKRVPVIVLTSSSAEDDIIKSYENYTNAYITKPVNPDQFVAVVRSMEEFWFTIVRSPPIPDESV